MKSKTSLSWLAGLLVAIGGSAIAMYLICYSCRTDFEKYLWNTLFSIISWLTLWGINSALNHFLDSKISWIKAPIKRLAAGLFLTVACTVVAVFLLMKGWELVRNFHYNAYGDIIINALFITFFISLFFHGRGFFLAWRQATIDAEHFKQESIKAQYQSLKNQVNPHFLFNSLNALTNLVYEDQDKAAKFIKQLSEVYRYVLDTRDKEVVLIQEELKFTESYLFLQNIRFGNKLKVQINLGNVQSKVAPLAIQMLIENAIKHNVISEEDPLTIQIYEEGDFVVIENNLQKKRVLDEDSSGLGLENIRKRYEFLSDKKVEVSDANSRFKVAIPKLTDN